MKMILPIIIFLSFFRLQCVLSTCNNSMIYGYSVGAGNEGHGSYRKSLANLLETFASQTTNPGLYNFTTSYPKSPNQLYGHYLCRGDVDHQACQSCVNFAKNYMLNKISFYSNSREGLAWYDHCMVRFSNQSFFGKLDVITRCSSWDEKNIVKGSRIRFIIILRDTLKDLAIRASNGQNRKRFASKVVQFTMIESLYVAAQCTPDLVASACHRCLANANKVLLDMRGSIHGNVYYSSCMVEYKTTGTFTNNKVVKPSSLLIPISPEDTNSTLKIRMRGTHLASNDRSE